MSFTEKDALDYHQYPKPGKIEVRASKACATQLDLSLAYTPGVAHPCNEIHADESKAYQYTAKGNLVAVITDGSAVLGLGNIGALAGKPVMEGKGVLFKRFANIDVFDIELKTQDPDEIIRTVQILEPTFGGINLEDIKAPECFYIEEQLKKTMNIPVFHDDQHGTAIICGAAFINGLKLVNKQAQDVKVVFSGAGAAAVACAKLFLSLGVLLENMLMVDSKGVIYKGRTAGMNPYKEEFAVETSARTLGDAMVDADVFIGVSMKDIVTKEMVAAMAKDPMIFAMANPDPEVRPEVVAEVRSDAIMATGRSDYPNQVNNVLGFPFIFRGALDVMATDINEEMKVAATMALARLAQEEVPEDVLFAYSQKKLSFGRDYIIPKPFDARVLYQVAPAVAKAAMESGVARKPIVDFHEYENYLKQLLHPSREVMLHFMSRAREGQRKRIVFPEGEHETILKAVEVILSEKLAYPVLLGNKESIQKKVEQLGLRFPEGEYGIINVWTEEAPHREMYAEQYLLLKERKGGTKEGAIQDMRRRSHYAMMMVRNQHADGSISGINKVYAETIRPALQIVGLAEPDSRVSGIYMITDSSGIARFFADTTVHFDPSAEDLAHIAIASADLVKSLGIEPRVAMLSFSNFGSAEHPLSQKVKKATRLAQEKRPDLIIEGEMRVDVAVAPERHAEDFPFCKLKESANVYIFPSLDAGNIATQLLQYLGSMEVVGPILNGFKSPINSLPRNCSVNEIVNMTAITAVMASKSE